MARLTLLKITAQRREGSGDGPGRTRHRMEAEAKRAG